jgi:RNA polymerase sigma factor for flagellar operon FliA
VQRLVEEHIPFVRSIARRLREQMPAIEFDDLVAFGMQGLVEAAQRYDERHGAVFTTFAYYRVRGAMFDGIRTMGWLPRNEYARLRFEERANAYLENVTTREAGARDSQKAATEEDAGASPVEQQVRELADALSGVATVFVTLMSMPQEEGLVDDQPGAHELLEQHQLGARVRRALSKLPDKERRLIEAYYFGDQTLEQVGAGMGLSKSWTSRLHARAVGLLRDLLQADEGAAG